MNLHVEVTLQNSTRLWFERRIDDAAPVLYGRGYAFLDGEFLSGQALVDGLYRRCLRDVAADESRERLRTLLPELNGAWALIAHWPEYGAVAACDRSRSIPLFYTTANGQARISDSLSMLADPDRAVNDVAAAEFFLSGFVSGAETCASDVFQVEPAQSVEFFGRRNTPRIAHHSHFDYFPGEPTSRSDAELGLELAALLERSFERFARAMKNRRFVLPLSGGLDSRLIAWLLRKYGVDDVLCYTYGVRSNRQVELARRVAKALGFSWRFVEYTPQRWSNCMASEEMRRYWDYAFNGASSPHLQDFPALMELAQSSNALEGAVLLPGHVGDAWASEFMLRSFSERFPHPPAEHRSPHWPVRNEVVSSIIYRHLNLWPLQQADWETQPLAAVADKLERQVAGFGASNPMMAYVEWVLRGRTACWIVNSVRGVEQFGGDFALTLGGNELIDFFRQLPPRLLYRRELYSQAVRKHIFNAGIGPLAEIPIISGVRKPNPFKRAAIDGLRALGLFNPLERWRRRLQKPRRLSADSWFTAGRPSVSVSVGEALSDYDLENHLPDWMLKVIRPRLRSPSYAIECNGLLTAALLSRFYAGDLPSSEGKASWPESPRSTQLARVSSR